MYWWRVCVTDSTNNCYLVLRSSGGSNGSVFFLQAHKSRFASLFLRGLELVGNLKCRWSAPLLVIKWPFYNYYFAVQWILVGTNYFFDIYKPSLFVIVLATRRE